MIEPKSTHTWDGDTCVRCGFDAADAQAFQGKPVPTCDEWFAQPAEDDRIRYGAKVRNGVLRYESPSGIDLADARNDGGCLRKWYYRYVMGLREPSTAAQEIGTQGHKEIEHYERTGEDVLGSIARTGMHMMLPPGPDLLVEWPLCPRPPGAAPRAPVDPRGSWLWLAGIPIIGYIDLGHARGINVGGADITATHDPVGTVEGRDWKFTGDPGKWAKTADAIGRATPMLAYGESLSRAYAAAGLPVNHVRLTHGYFNTKKREPGFTRTILLPRDEVRERWEGVAPVVRDIIDAARAERPEDVPGNTRACHAFKGCQHLPYCSAGQRGSLEKIFGRAGVADLMKESPNMSVLDALKLPGLTPTVPAAPAAPPAPPPPAFPPGFDAAWQDITDAGYGFPSVSGEAANALTALKGWKVPPGTAHNGEGRLAALPAVGTVAEIFKIATDLRPMAEQNRAARAAMPAILPPDAPPSTPALASVPVALTPAEVAQGIPAGPPAAAAPPVVNVTVTTPMPVAGPAPEPVAPPKKTRKKKTADGGTPVQGAPVEESDGVTLYVDAIPDEPYVNLARHVTEWCDSLAKAANQSDIRNGDDKTSPLAYGKWKGTLTAYVRESYDAGAIPAGVYVLDARGSEIGEVIAEALRSKVDRYARGVR